MTTPAPPTPTPAPTPKVLAFDVFGTVVDWHGSISRAVESLRPGVDGDAFALAWRAGYQPAMRRTMAAMAAGTGGFRVLDELHLEILREILPGFPALTDLSEAEVQALNRAWHALDAWPDAAGALARLKARFVITPLSNGGIGLLTHMAKRARLPWDAVLGAEVFQAYKPDPRTYRGVARVLGVEPRDVMMVATHHADLDAAQDAGLQTAYVERPAEMGPRPGLKDDSPKARHPLHFKDLHALADYLGCD